MDLKITTIQVDLAWEDKLQNLSKFDEILRGVTDSDIILLPEMFTTAFSMKPAQFAEPLFGDTFQWLTKKSQELNAAIVTSFICVENGQYFNRLIFMKPDGNYFKYDKRHLFTLAGEHLHYMAGEERITIDYKGWRICPLICYDLRFPVWSRNALNFNLNKAGFSKSNTLGYYDVLLYVANWPERRNHAWKSLLMARAIENQCYVAAVNRVGEDGNGVAHSGDTSVIDFAGNILFQQSYTEGVNSTILSRRKLEDFRNKFGFLSDQDAFSI